MGLGGVRVSETCNWQVTGLPFFSGGLTSSSLNYGQFFALRRFLSIVRGFLVLVRTDSTTVALYLIKQGGMSSPSLCRLRLLKWCQAGDVNLEVECLLGEENRLADYLSKDGQMGARDRRPRGPSLRYYLHVRQCVFAWRKSRNSSLTLSTLGSAKNTPPRRNKSFWHSAIFVISWSIHEGRTWNGTSLG